MEPDDGQIIFRPQVFILVWIDDCGAVVKEVWSIVFGKVDIMKKLFILLMTLVMGLSACQTAEISYEVPNYPSTMSREAFLEKAEKEGLKTEQSDGRSVWVSGFQIFGISTEMAQFLFVNDGKILQHIVLQVDKKYQETLLEKMKKQYGEPVSSYRQPDYSYFAADGLRKSIELLRPEEIMEGVELWVWHDEKPLSQTWTQEEREKFREVILSNFGRTGEKREGEDEDWNIYFENSWQSIIKLMYREEKDKLFLTWSSMYIPEIPEKE